MERFGRYQLIKRLGAGGMGEVFLARREDSDDPVVLKRILPHLTENPRFLKLFLDETRIASRLVHPNIARIHELGEVDGVWFVAMEHVQGHDLRELLSRMREMEAPAPVGVTVKVGIEVCRALEYAHTATDETGRSLHIVHRDVSPHNVLIGRDGAVKLIDFGVAKAANKSVHTATGMLKGKFPYMSPEQSSGKPVDARTDVFALGIVLWEMLAGRYLFRLKTDADTVKAVRAAVIPDLREMRPDVPEALDRAIRKALRKDMDARFQDVKAFREALEAIDSQLKPSSVRRWVHEYDDVEGIDGSGEVEFESLEEEEEGDTEVEVLSVETVGVRNRPDGQPVESRLEAARKLLAQVSGRPTNIGSQATSFIGRVAELADLHQLFRHGQRLITILGPGGTGKTRVSLQFGTQLVSYFQELDAQKRPRGGVWFCDLTEATDLESVCAAVARALAIPLAPGDPVAQLGHALAARHETLLVLDNFEQVVAHAPETLGRWMAAAPEARFVVSSREMLRVENEHVFELSPLRLPVKSDEARRAEAVQLFVERARVVRPGWEPSDAEFQAIAEVVRQLDGMPLAIELAAARMGMLSPTQLVQRLPRRFELLVDRTRTDERQATLKGAIDWSWQMLTPPEADMLAQLSVFRGGFSVDAAEAVVDLSQHPEADSVAILMMLRTKSLVRAYFPLGDEQATRFGLYESIREFAREKLEALGTADEAMARHAKFTLQFTERLARNAEGDALSLAILDIERENVNAVYQRAVATRALTSKAMRAVLALDPLLTLRGPFKIHPVMMDAALERVPPGKPEWKLLGLEARGRLRQARGQLVDAERDYRDALELAETLKDDGAQGRMHSFIGGLERLKGQRAEARRYFELALTFLRKVSDRRMEGRTLSNYAGLLTEVGEVDEALAMYDEALEIHRQMRDRRYEGITLSNLGVHQQSVGLLKQARTQYQLSLNIHRELGNRRSEGISHINLGDLARDLEQQGQGLMHYNSALTILREVGARRFEGIALVSQAALLQQGQQLERAAEAYTEGLKILQILGDQRWVGLGLAGLAAVEALRDQLDRAEELMAQASSTLSETNDAAFLDALDVYRGVIEVARARKSKSASEARTLTARAEKRAAHAEKAQSPDALHPAGVPSPADRSEHVRSALRTLNAALKSATSTR